MRVWKMELTSRRFLRWSRMRITARDRTVVNRRFRAFPRRGYMMMMGLEFTM